MESAIVRHAASTMRNRPTSAWRLGRLVREVQLSRDLLAMTHVLESHAGDE